MRIEPKRKWLWVAVSVGAVLAAVLGSIVWRASRALRQATEQSIAEDEIHFASVTLSRPLPSNIDWVSAPAVWKDAIIYRGHLYIAGPAGLSELDSEGKMLARYRTGMELPPFPLAALATGLLSSSDGPELFVATQGAGLLAFNGVSSRQIRPEEAGYRDLTAVLPLSTGRILLGTSKKGVLVYDGRRLSRFHAAVSDLPVTALAGSESDLWIGTPDRGAFHWHAGQTARISESEGLPDRQVLSIATEGNRT